MIMSEIYTSDYTGIYMYMLKGIQIYIYIYFERQIGGVVKFTVVSYQIGIQCLGIYVYITTEAGLMDSFTLCM